MISNGFVAPAAPAAASSVVFVWSRVGGALGRVVASRAALSWRAGLSSLLRFESVLASGRVVVSFVSVCSLRAAAFRCRAFCAGRGVVACRCFLSDGRWVASALA